MANQSPNQPPSEEQRSLLKGKLPRNAMVSIGVLVAVCIGGMGFLYELKAADKAAEETKEKKAAALKVGTADVPVAQQQQDMDEIIRQQREQAASDARALTVKVTTPPTTTRPMLTGDDFRNDISKDPTGELAAKSDADMIYISPIFKQNGATRNRQSSTPAIPEVITPAQMHAAQQAAGGTAAEQMAVQLAKQGQAPENRDKEFLQDAATQSGIVRTTFNGRAVACTLTPPHNIHVTAVEGLNSDKPGRVALMVDEDVYDSIRGDCLMIPKASFINGEYSSDVKVGQERLLVASTSLRLPNGKSVPMNGMQGADENGYAGFSGDVNSHFLKIYGAGFLTAILLKAFDSSSQTATTASANGVTTYGDTAGQVAATTAQSILSRNQNIEPTITVKPGAKFLIQVTQDIVLEPYHE